MTQAKLPYLIEKYNQPIPRYTSYPPANHFISEFDHKQVEALIDESNHATENHIAFYVHIPFCKKICYYCGCNAHKLPKNDNTQEYLEALRTEIREVKKRLYPSRKISQIHFGGGTPNSLPAQELTQLVQLMLTGFETIENPEIAVECNPADLDLAYLDELAQGGFNRISLGIQDFDPEILRNVNRLPSKLPVVELVAHLRNHHPHISVNLDFIYGLPGQTTESFLNSIQQAIAIKPDRLVTFSYAHVPWLKKHQQILEKKGLPSPQEKMDIFLSSRDALLQAGYRAIGLDHYVLPNDELAQAIENHQLHRNFQGYCTRRTTGQVYAVGVSSISQFENAYIQNKKTIPAYIQSIQKGEWPGEGGLILKPNEIIVREAITEIMCNLYLDLNALASRFNCTPNELKTILNYDEQHLTQLADDGLMEWHENILRVTETGSHFVRNIASQFDPAFDAGSKRYSQSV